jgi:hypothetical protein
LGIGDWGLGIGDWAQSPIPKIKNKELKYKIKLYKIINNK